MFVHRDFSSTEVTPHFWGAESGVSFASMLSKIYDSNAMQQIHVLTNFKLFIPINGEDDNQFHVDQTTNPTLGVTISKENTKESWQYQVDLINCEGSKEIKINRALIWARRAPHKLQTNVNTKLIEGLVIQVKVNAGLFDFRTIKERLIRFEVKCFSGGRLLSQGTSALVQLLAKKRYASEKESEIDEVPIIPVAWTSTPEIVITESNTNEPRQYNELYAQRSFVALDPPGTESPSTNFSASNEHSPYSIQEIASEDNMIVPMENYELNLFGSGSDSIAEIETPANYEDNEQYMVLYNGNAEVIGNFRALNFYKASDINLKEDIRYISDNVDPREALLRIDGVEYKFKDGVKGNNNSKKRFVGYIAQQIENVVPQAVQLINGILHVDYESLLPYLSESIKKNFNDINELKSNVSHVTLLMDMLYKEFTAKEQRRNNQNKRPYGDSMAVSERKKSFMKRNKFRWLMIGGAILVLAVSVAVGGYFIWASQQQIVNGPNDPQSNTTSPIIVPAAPSPIEVPIPIPIPIAVPVSDPGPPIDILARERAILEELYYATGGPNWIAKGNWLTNASVCSWQGVNCDTNNRVTSLQFSEPNNMTGTLPESLGELTMLTDLQLMQTDVGGTIPKMFRGLVHLKNLWLYENKFQGQFPTEIFNLTELEAVSIKGNFFDPWTLPSWINSTSMMNLYLYECNLMGTVPPELGTMNSLRTITIIHNSLEGTLPSFTSASQLMALRFLNTSLIGEIPEIPLSLSELKLANNKLTGGLDKLPSSWQGDWLDLMTNNFSGKFTLSATTMMTISTVNIAYNNFTSASDYAFPVSIDCNIAGNSIACPLPQWMRLCTGAVCK